MAEMNFAVRERIFSKEAITIQDLQDLMSLSYPAATRLMLDIKNRFKLQGKPTLNIQGKLLLRDYFEYFGIDPNQLRYFPDREKAKDYDGYVERMEDLHGHAEQ